jgi:hypothetical protein
VELIGRRIVHPTLELLNAVEGTDVQAIAGERVRICRDVFVEGAEGVDKLRGGIHRLLLVSPDGEDPFLPMRSRCIADAVPVVWGKEIIGEEEAK